MKVLRYRLVRDDLARTGGGVDPVEPGPQIVPARIRYERFAVQPPRTSEFGSRRRDNRLGLRDLPQIRKEFPCLRHVMPPDPPP